MHARKKGPERGSVYTPNEAMKDILARCHKKTDVQVCTLTIMHCCPVTVNIRAIATYATFLQSAISISTVCMYKNVTVTLTDVYFSQVKNEPWHPWVYTWFWHCREQYILYDYRWTFWPFGPPTTNLPGEWGRERELKLNQMSGFSSTLHIQNI
jgi:hypothetical protein